MEQESKPQIVVQKVDEKNVDINETSVPLGPLTLRSPIGIGTWAWGDSKTWGYNTYDSTFNDQTIDV
jgi:hypothetical protein